MPPAVCFISECCMDREMTLKHLDIARGHIARGEKHIARQRQIVDMLARGGHASSEAVSMLRQFEELQAEHVNRRDKLEEELKQC